MGFMSLTARFNQSITEDFAPSSTPGLRTQGAKHHLGLVHWSRGGLSSPGAQAPNRPAGPRHNVGGRVSFLLRHAICRGGGSS